MEFVASNPPSAMTDVGDGELDADTVLVDGMIEEDKLAEEAISEEAIMGELTPGVEDAAEVANSGVEVVVVDAALEIANEELLRTVEDISAVDVAKELEELVDNVPLELIIA